MKLKGRILLIIFGFIAYWNSYAQSFQFSQYDFTSQRVNPAAVSLSNYAKVAMNYRSQSTVADFNVKSTYLELSYPFIKANGGNRWSGLGVSFMDDRAGQGGLFKISEIGLSYAVNIPIAKQQTFNLGFRTVYQNRRVSLDGLFTGSQFVQGRGFDNSLSLGEAGTGLAQNFFSFSSGLTWQKLDKEGLQNAYFGLSFLDFNQPEESFFETNNTLPSTFVLSSGFKAYEKDAFQIFPEVLFSSSASRSNINVGTVWKYNLANSPYAINASGQINVITKYVIDKYFIAGIQFEKDNFKIGVSYDVPAGQQIGNEGTIEFGAELKSLVASRSKVPRRKNRISRNRRVKYKRIKNRRIKAKRLKAKRNKRKKNRKKDEKLLTSNEKELKQAKKEEPDEIEPKNAKGQTDLIMDKDLALNGGKSDSEVVVQDTVDLSARAGNLNRHPLELETTRLRFHFKFDSHVVDQESKDYLDDLSNVLKQDQRLKVEIIGHTDYYGTVDYNQKLSERRADMVKVFLIERGISADRISTSGKGELEPIRPNITPEGRGMNRRVEFILSY